MNGMIQQIYNISRPIDKFIKHIYTRQLYNRRLFTTTASVQRREVLETTQEKTTIVEGKTTQVDYSKQLQLGGNQHSCALCRLGLKIRYTDVLILRQFMTKEGDLLPKKITGLCYDQHKEVNKCIEQAKRAGLLSEYRPAATIEETNHMFDYKWRKYNVYFEDEDKHIY